MKVQIKNETKKFLSDKMFGLFFEDINYAADGGLYAEMLENRQFNFKKVFAGKKERTYETENACDYGWKTDNSSDCKLTIVHEDGLSKNNPHYMNFTVDGDNGSFTNKAYDGVCLTKGSNYQLTIWARTPEYAGNITVSAKAADSNTNAFQCTITVRKSNDWTKITATIMAEENVKNGIFTINQHKGTADYGYISFMPCDAVAGVFRKDLFNLLKDLRPGFLRFPGGCIVEGASLDNRYKWKDTVGQPWERVWNWSRWAVHDIHMGQKPTPEYFPYYNQSYGIGFYEYFVLSELLGAKPLPVLSVGLACQFQSDQLVAIDSKEFQTYIQDALDLVEFANGDKSTKWGSLRVQMGHVEPFGLEYIGIGNEQWETENCDFYNRYTAFKTAIHKKYPEIKLIGTAGPDVVSERYTKAWDFFNRNYQKTPEFTAAIDEHYYMPPAWFYEHINMYDSYSRNIPVFAGEYAAHTTNKQNNMEAALAEAAFMTGLEKNCDVIRFASVAPLFARKGYAQWIPDFIWFDGNSCMGTPGYYVQKLYGAYTGNYYMNHNLQNAGEKLYSSVTKDSQKIYIKIINSSAESSFIESIVLEDTPFDIKKAAVIQMKAPGLETQNVLGGENSVKLEQIENSFEKIQIPPYSCSVIILDI